MTKTVAPFLNAFTEWVAGQDRLQGVLLVGSHARETATDTSDVDVIMLADDPQSYLRDRRWVETFGNVVSQNPEHYGRVVSLRVHYESQLEVEFGLTDHSWAAFPLDAGTEEVIAGGVKVLFERGNVLRHVRRASEFRRQLVPAVKRSGEARLVAQDEQIRIVNALKDHFNHSITFVLRDSDVARPVGQAVNCYEFALGLFEHPRYWEILNKARLRIPAQGLLLEDLIAAGLERLDSARDDAVVVYGHDCIGHVGRARGDSVRSKWSPGGCVWDHAPIEVPETYGRLMGYFAPPQIDQTLRIFENEMSGVCKEALNWYNAH